MKLLEFKAIIDALVELHPEASIDFVYPARHSGKRTSKLGDCTTYKVLLGDLGIVRFVLDWADPAGKLDIASVRIAE